MRTTLRPSLVLGLGFSVGFGVSVSVTEISGPGLSNEIEMNKNDESLPLYETIMNQMKWPKTGKPINSSTARHESDSSSCDNSYADW